MHPLRHVCLIVCICLLGMTACTTAEATPEPTPSPQPSPTIPPVPTATPFVMPTAEPSQTPIPTTPTMTPFVLDILTGIQQPPPIDITLPNDWRFGYDTLILPDVGEYVYQPFAVYTGAVTDGIGTITLLWDYRSITTGNPLSPDFGTTDGWIDGLRLLRTVVFENECNFGTAPRRDDYSVGGLPAVGTLFSAVDCPELPDTRGWFAALTVNERKFIFYMYTEPIEAMDGQAPFDLQAILDSIVFAE